MSQLYVNESSAKVGVSEGRVVVRYNNGLERYVPIESVEGISLFGPVSISSQCVRECLERGIDVQYYSSKGNYYGKLNSTRHVNVARQRLQSRLGEDESFCQLLSKQIIRAKIHNQIVVLRRYMRSLNAELDDDIRIMKNSERKIDNAQMLDELLGFEGMAARAYYHGLGKLVISDFRFSGRSRRPPKDAFNSMLSLGYTLLMYELYGTLEARGLNPYFGFMHKDREKHPTLASDVMEEWRAVIVDSVVMSIVNGHEIKKENFYCLPEKPGVFLDKTGFRVFITKLEKRFNVEQRYLPYIDYPVSFRRAINMQIGELVKAIESGDANLYAPIIIR